MNKIYKYPLPLFTSQQTEFKINTHLGSRIIHLGIDPQSQPSLWIIVNTSNNEEKRKFRIVGTGHEIDDYGRHSYVGTYIQPHSVFVWHVFEVMF